MVNAFFATHTNRRIWTDTVGCLWNFDDLFDGCGHICNYCGNHEVKMIWCLSTFLSWGFYLSWNLEIECGNCVLIFTGPHTLTMALSFVSHTKYLTSDWKTVIVDFVWRLLVGKVRPMSSSFHAEMCKDLNQLIFAIKMERHTRKILRITRSEMCHH